MANPEIYAHTYWCHKGKHPQAIEALNKLVPAEGEVKDRKKNRALEKFRKASNCYYDLYNNGLGNRRSEFRRVFGFSGPSCPHKELTVEIVNRTEAAMDAIIVEAAKEQGITVDGEITETIPTEIPAAAEIEKPFVQLTGEDGNVFSIIGRVTRALKKAKQPDKAKEFTDKAFSAKSYDEVLRLTMEYCEVG